MIQTIRVTDDSVELANSAARAGCIGLAQKLKRPCNRQSLLSGAA
jgi:hypothetical protein